MASFLANENVPGPVVQALRAAGMDVGWIAEFRAGADDETVLGLALSQRRVLITFDKDFGELVFGRGREASCGVVLFRSRLRSPESLSQFALNALARPIEWEGNFSVAEAGRIRVAPLPS